MIEVQTALRDCIARTNDDSEEDTCTFTLQFYSNKSSNTAYPKMNLTHNEDQCPVSCLRTNVPYQSHLSNSKTFWIYILVRSLNSFFYYAVCSVMVSKIDLYNKLVRRQRGTKGKIVRFCGIFCRQ